jgi:tRNA modification GTPase
VLPRKMKLSNSADVIVAVATPPGKAALAMIRVSGAGAIAMVSRLIPELNEITPERARRLYLGYALDTEGKALDEITAIPYLAPKSYSGEEMVEIICHGGFISSRIIMERLTELGARIAEPGEFTKRAFVNGRISLSQAEAVAAMIEAKSELALKAAARNLKGELYQRIDLIRRAIRDLLTLIEAEIDFSDEEIEKTSAEKIKVEIADQLKNSQEILRSYDFGRGLTSGYRVAIVGRANTGKSSLLNSLLRRERAIVTEIPGTTRDTLTEWIEIAGFPILLTDTAGLRESVDKIEAIGQERTRAEIEKSDLILFMIDLSTGVTDDDLKIYRTIADKPTVLTINKIDLADKSKFDSKRDFPNEDYVFISAKTGEGLDKLHQRIAHELNLDHFSLEYALLATERQYHSMKKVCETLTQALADFKSSPPPEAISVFLRETLDHMGELVGETTSEDILNNIFGKFCIGK